MYTYYLPNRLRKDGAFSSWRMNILGWTQQGCHADNDELEMSSISAGEKHRRFFTNPKYALRWSNTFWDLLWQGHDTSDQSWFRGILENRTKHPLRENVTHIGVDSFQRPLSVSAKYAI